MLARSQRTIMDFESLRKRWVYHFIISPNTSTIEKPEWYFNQTLKWIDENKLLTKNLIELALMRLNKDMSGLADILDHDPQAEAILIHTYNEAIQFTKAIRERRRDIDIMFVFSDQKLFEKIMDVEWEHAERNLKEIRHLDNRWGPVLEGEFVDTYKVPRCVDRLLLLIKSITDRVECFKQLDCQFQLIELQCSLFNKFLLFLKKSTESSPVRLNILSDILFFSDDSTIDLTRILRILNAVNFLRLILIEQYFIPKNVVANLDASLLDKSKKLVTDYRSTFDKLIAKVVTIYDEIDCDYEKFIDFIKPKLSHNIYEIIRDETSKIYQQRHTAHLLKGLTFSGK